ncbi:MAG: PTS sugar transporter subunit IIA [Polyangiaceae bacterium]|nr:PTS sugar transporter subunit IIA [Polyangiaceae bacterium]
MKLNQGEAANLVGVSEGAIIRLAKDGAIPCQRLEGEYWFHRAELLEWATARGFAVATDAFSASRRANDLPLPRFAHALQIGGIHHGITARNRDEALRAVVDCLPVEDESERELLLAVMAAREAMGSTGIGDGIAIPHARAPVLLETRNPSIVLCFLEQPVSFGAVDGRPVHTLFSMVTHTVRSHLHLLARLAASLRDPDFRRTVLERAPAPRILAEATRVELQLGHPGPEER